jgi:hypothetical protein
MNVDAVSNDAQMTGKERLKAFRFGRIAATGEGKWRTCRYTACRRRKKCVGGPRGTVRKLGSPICSRDGGELPFGLEKTAVAGDVWKGDKGLY